MFISELECERSSELWYLPNTVHTKFKAFVIFFLLLLSFLISVVKKQKINSGCFTV